MMFVQCFVEIGPSVKETIRNITIINILLHYRETQE